MSTTFTPARPSALGAILHGSGVVFGRVCRFSLDLIRESVRYSGSPSRKRSHPSPQKTPPAAKPKKVFTMKEIEQIPTVLRLAGVEQEEWYRTHVLEPEAQRREDKRVADDEYFRLVFDEPDEGDDNSDNSF